MAIKKNYKVNRDDLPDREEEQAKKRAERRAENEREREEKRAAHEAESREGSASAAAGEALDTSDTDDTADLSAAEEAGDAASAGKSAPKPELSEKEKKAAERRKRAARRKLMKRGLSKTGKIVLVCIGILAMVLSVSVMAFSGFINQSQNQTSYKLTGGVAATVKGTNITEDTITKQIMSTRNSGGYTTDKKWAQYLVDNGLTPETLREQTINSYAQQYLVQVAAQEEGITVTNEDMDKAWSEAATSYGGESQLESLITQLGYTKDTYKENVLKENIEQQKLKDKVAKAKTPSDDDIIKYLNENLATYNDARRSENLLIKVDSNASDDDKAKAKAKAQEALDKINSGELSFEDAVEQYSDDSASKKEKGDVGWDKLTSFVTEYQTALSALQKDQVSGIVESSYGYHIIKCTDYWHVDGQVTSIDQVPDKIKDYVSNAVKTQAASDAYTKWMADYTKKANLKINPMPKDVPYNVSLDGVTASSTNAAATGTAGSTESSTTGTTESSTTGTNE